MKWIKVKIDYFSDELNQTKENLINILSEIGIKQIEVSDFFTDNSLDYNVNLKKESDVWSITGYIIDNRFANLKLNIIYEKLSEYSEIKEDFIYEIYTAKCSDEDWQDEWKKYFHTVNITENIVIKPSWDSYEAIDDEIVIEIDPGLAFGTGTHPTTQLSLTALEQTIRGGESVLDVGTGSGVLSIASKLLGAGQVTAFDIDEMATRVAKENIALNPTIDAIDVYENNLLVGVDQKSDLIVANILAEILVQMPKDAYRNLNENGTLILSGIIESKAREVQEAYEEAGFTLVERMTMKEWNCFVMKKDVE